MGITVDESARFEGLRKYDSWFQLVFRTSEVWDLQDQIFSMWEHKEVKGQRAKKEKLDPQVEMESKSCCRSILCTHCEKHTEYPNE